MSNPTIAEAMKAVDRVAAAGDLIRPPVTAAQMVEWLRELDALIREHSSHVD